VSSLPSQEVVRVEQASLRAVRFKDERSRTPVPWEGPALELVGARHVARVEKKGTPAFSAVEYADGAQRGMRGVRQATALVLDFDHLSGEQGELVLRKLRAVGWAHLACSSYSHLAEGPDDQCFRVVVIVSRPILPAEYEPVWVATNGALGRLADANARDISRLWFVASCPPERLENAWVRPVDGRPLDVDRAIAASGLKPGPRKKRKGANAPLSEGERNAGLLRLGGSLRRKGADRDELLAALHAANVSRCDPPLADGEVIAVVDSLLRYDPASPLLVLNLTDAGNAERFQAHVGDRFAFAHPWGSWMHFDGVRWQRDGSGESVRAALATLRAMAGESEKVPDEDHRGGLLKHALESESSARLAAMLTLGQAMLPIAPEALDQDPDLLNVANGTLDLRTGELRPHDRRDWLTRLAPVRYEPDAVCPLWESFLRRVMGGNERLIGFLQRAVGYSLTGHGNEQVLFLLYGVGANGKSTFLETVRALLADYSTTADFTTFLKRDNEGARNDLARLVGTRFVAAVEAEAGKPLAEALVKQLTGGDTITARFLFKEFFDFRPQFKIWLAANHKPGIYGSDHGIWRRIRLVPFTVTIPEAERDPRLVAKLAAELPGILAWAVRGCLAWRERGLGVPDEVRAATASYREEMDLFGGFLDEGCIAEGGAVVTAKDLYVAYQGWCEANGEKPRSQKALSVGLKERGFEAGRMPKGARCWRGLRLRREGEALPTAGDGCRMGDATSGYFAPVDQEPHGAQAPCEGRALRVKYPGDTSPTCHPSPPDPTADGWEEGDL
jgi:putative DNA primase/helicase